MDEHGWAPAPGASSFPTPLLEGCEHESNKDYSEPFPGGMPSSIMLPGLAL